MIVDRSNLKRKDFMMKREDYRKNKVEQRKYLDNSKTCDPTRKLCSYFESMVEVERMRRGKRQTIETLMNEEAFLLAMDRTR